MSVRALVVVVLVGLAGCGTPSSVVRGVALDEPTRQFQLDLPEGYRVVSATAGSDVSGSDGSSSSELFLNVIAEHEATGERVLLLYQGVERRAAPVAVFRFRSDGRAPAPAASGEAWDRP